ncbi:hypothetical protein BD770DRAFT_387151 [Pilaira anomala]|nr:hypothetical protein BD770DRAFT_387151 [Pilaira anomala]
MSILFVFINIILLSYVLVVKNLRVSDSTKNEIKFFQIEKKSLLGFYVVKYAVGILFRLTN